MNFTNRMERDMRGFGETRQGGWLRNCFIMKLEGSFEWKKKMLEKIHMLEG